MDCKVELLSNPRKTCGRDMWYPINGTAKFFCELKGTKCLTTNEIQVLLKYGYDISYIGCRSDVLENLGIKQRSISEKDTDILKEHNLNILLHVK